MMLVLYGPTVTGKTDLAIKLAQKYNGELISADSRQVYKGLDIGTGKVSFVSRVEKHGEYWIVDGVKIQGFDLVYPGEQFNVADFIKFASSSIVQTIELSKLPIVVGGTGFYIKSLIEGFGTIGIPANRKLREKLERLSVKELQIRLSEIDQEKIKVMNKSDRSNPRRLIRAIEVASSHLTTQPNYPTTQNYLLIGLSAPNEYLYQRADNWLETRLNRGLVKEVDGLIKKGVSSEWLENLGLEYRWMTRCIQGKISLEEAKKRLQGDIHEFIRRQKTFFNQFADIKLFDISKENWLKELEKTVSTWYNQQDGRIYSSS